MSWGQYHEVPYKSGIEEKILGPFSFYKLGWIGSWILVSNQIASVFPMLPFGGDTVFGWMARVK